MEIIIIVTLSLCKSYLVSLYFRIGSAAWCRLHLAEVIARILFSAVALLVGSDLVVVGCCAGEEV